MKQIAQDFTDECNALQSVLADTIISASDNPFELQTQFKGWTISDVLIHLHMWNVAAGLSLQEGDAFNTFFAGIATAMMAGRSHRDMGREWAAEKFGGDDAKLFAAWSAYYPELAQSYQELEPGTRLQWAGPPMSARDSLIARQMETWAHGQAAFDVLGVPRNDTDRIKNIAHLGVKTYSWTFKVRQLDAPKPKPFVCLTAPSGAIWKWNDEQTDNYVKGSATEFCQVVTQTRNIADTRLEVVGEAATLWMANAQCFAGGAEVPPAKGLRFCAPSP